jgi:hypothetical protein
MVAIDHAVASASCLRNSSMERNVAPRLSSTLLRRTPRTLSLEMRAVFLDVLEAFDFVVTFESTSFCRRASQHETQGHIKGDDTAVASLGSYGSDYFSLEEHAQGNSENFSVSGVAEDYRVPPGYFGHAATRGRLAVFKKRRNKRGDRDANILELKSVADVHPKEGSPSTQAKDERKTPKLINSNLFRKLLARKKRTAFHGPGHRFDQICVHDGCCRTYYSSSAQSLTSLGACSSANV